MAEPENHTLRLLRDIRSEIGEIRSQGERTQRGVDDLRKEMTQGFEHVGEQLEHLSRLVRGESVLGRYAAANVDERIEALEKRVNALEERR